jgi:C-terminal processing protease CtpA/Prc
MRRSGMWINQGDGNLVIIDVVDGGPAQAAGLKKGDTIMAIDGKPASKVHLYDLRKRLRNDAQGTLVVFTLKEGSGTKDVMIKLAIVI